jgi:hypothetical protein
MPMPRKSLLSSISKLDDPPGQNKARVRKHMGYFIVPIPSGKYEIWGPDGRLKVTKPNVTKARQWIGRRVR